jgi:hypothetical protein
MHLSEPIDARKAPRTPRVIGETLKTRDLNARESMILNALSGVEKTAIWNAQMRAGGQKSCARRRLGRAMSRKLH